MLFRYRVPKSRTWYKENQKFLNVGSTSMRLVQVQVFRLHIDGSEFQFGGFETKNEGMLHYDISMQTNFVVGTFSAGNGDISSCNHDSNS